MIDIFSLTAKKLVEKLKEGEISSVEVCEQYINEASKKSDQDRTADNKEKT